MVVAGWWSRDRIVVASRLSLVAAIIGATIGIAIEPVPTLTAEATTTCSAGTVSTDNSASPVIVVTFTAPASGDANCTWTVPANVYSVDYLVVAGGGGGASGGGGAGGVATSWSTRIGATTTARSTPLSVTPGDDISVTVGAGGAGGAGGSARYYGTAGTAHQALPGSGHDSVFGSIIATGGGAGGHRRSDYSGVLSGDGQAGGSSGGASYDRNQNAVTAAVASTAVGARSYGNAGGASLAGSYSAGGGGGGAGGSGGNTRTLAANCNAENCVSYYHGGGNGGAGIESNITGSWVTYACGGGGGVNSNTAKVVVNGGGTAGCSSSGRGSSYSAYAADYNTASLPNSITLSQWQGAIGTAGAAGFGGGGGGTDPEDTRGQEGGSGRVVLRYTIVDANCPNSTNTTQSTPLACPTDVTVQADGSAVDATVLTGPVSYSGSGASLSVIVTPTASPTTGNLSATVVDTSKLRFSVPSGSSLIGGTYPVIYRITSSSGVTSESYVLVTVEDPNQVTPIRLPVDPRTSTYRLPNFPLGDSSNVLVCITENSGDGHATAATVSVPSAAGVTVETRTRGISLRGTRANVQAVIDDIDFVAPSGATLVPDLDSPRVFTVNVSNTSNGGNNSCSGGTRSEMTLDALELGTTNHLLVWFLRN